MNLTIIRQLFFRFLFFVMIASGLAAGAAHAQELPSATGSPADPPRYTRGENLAMVRFEFDNDTWLGSDDAYSAGWSLQFHSGLKDEWTDPVGKRLAKVPLWSDDGEGGRVVRWSAGLSQLIVTPADLTIEELQPEEPPYAGVLGIHSAWASYDNRRLSALQLYAGCIGPCSQAEQVQKFVHEDMHYGESPQGWDNQLDQRFLANVNYAWRYKVVAAPEDRYWSRRWANDFSVGGQLAAGNAAQFAEAQVEYRVGWGLPGGFTHIPDPVPRGVVMDPVYPPTNTARSLWRGYASVVVRAAVIDRNVVSDGGRTVNGGHHPRFDPNEDEPQVVTGFHVARAGYALHLSYYRFLGSRDREGPGSTTDWINVSVERRF